jgi:hypothetical protein
MNKNINEDLSDFASLPQIASNISNFTKDVSFGPQFLNEVVPFWTSAIAGTLAAMLGIAKGGKLVESVKSLIDKYIVKSLKKDPELLKIVNIINQIHGSSQEENLRRRDLYDKAFDRIQIIIQNSPFLRMLNIPPEKQQQFIRAVRMSINVDDIVNQSRKPIDNPQQ